MSDLEEPSARPCGTSTPRGDLYDLAYRDGQYIARRIDATGPALTAATPEELDAAIRADQAGR